MLRVLTSKNPSCMSKMAKGLKAHALEHYARDIHQRHSQQATEFAANISTHLLNTWDRLAPLTGRIGRRICV